MHFSSETEPAVFGFKEEEDFSFIRPGTDWNDRTRSSVSTITPETDSDGARFLG